MATRSLILPLPDSKLLVITASKYILPCHLHIYNLELRLDVGIQDAPVATTPLSTVETSHLTVERVNNVEPAQPVDEYESPTLRQQPLAAPADSDESHRGVKAPRPRKRVKNTSEPCNRVKNAVRHPSS